jgi:UDP-glucose 4-epimerase
MLELLGDADHPIVEIGSRTPGDQFAVSAATARALEVLGWQGQTDLHTGLEAMLRWARDLDS